MGIVPFGARCCCGCVMPLDDQPVNTSYSDLPDHWNDDMSNRIYNAMTYDLQASEEKLLIGSTNPVLSHQTLTPVCRGTNGPLDLFINETDSWQHKPVKSWDRYDIIRWIHSEARNLGILCTELAGEKFGSMDGMRLGEFTETDFINCDRHYGKILYEKLQHIISEEERLQQYDQYMNKYSCDSYIIQDTVDIAGIKNETPCFIDLDKKEDITSSMLISTSENVERDLTNKKPESPPKKRKPGRPSSSKRKKKPEKLGRLWEFIRDLLKNKETCPSLIVWDNYEEGMFRFVHSDKVAKLWGTKKDNPDMNYEKLSRAMRYYYKKKVLLPVLGRRLVYKFGPTATGWKVENPNFKH